MKIRYIILGIVVVVAGGLIGYIGHSAKNFMQFDTDTAHATKANAAAISALQNAPRPAPVVIVQKPVTIVQKTVRRMVVVPPPKKPEGLLSTILHGLI